METLKKEHIFTVSEITRNIRALLDDNFGAVWVEGEIANFIKHTSGHMYFSIRDKDSTLSSVLFRGANIRLKFEIKNGMRVLCFGKISVYDKRGQYQLYVNKIEPKGAGALAIAFEQLKERLRKEGLFDRARKRPIPYLPRRVGVITSPTGAAIRDILNIVKRRFSNIEIILNPVRVQGDMAKNEIVDAIELFNALENVDVVILGRGGGSMEDLWPFNEEIVARAITRSKAPVISAVGHEVDYTISDFVSDFRAPTPSAAAELVIPKKEDLTALLRAYSDRIESALFSKLEFLNEKIDSIKNRYVLRDPLNIVLRHEQEIDDLAQEIALKGGYIVKFKTELLNTLAAKLEALSPLAILNRGYSITMKEKNGEVIKDAARLKKNELIKTKLAGGEVMSRVEEAIWQK